MNPLTPDEIRGSFVNCSQGVARDLPLPPGTHEIDWKRREYLGWRDPRQPQRGFIVVPHDIEGVVGIVLRASDASFRSSVPTVCSWCHEVYFMHDVYLWSASLAGEAGRRGNTVGAFACGDFECSENVRRKPPENFVSLDKDQVITARIGVLAERVQGFASTILGERTR